MFALHATLRREYVVPRITKYPYGKWKVFLIFILLVCPNYVGIFIAPRTNSELQYVTLEINQIVLRFNVPMHRKSWAELFYSNPILVTVVFSRRLRLVKVPLGSIIREGIYTQCVRWFPCDTIRLCSVPIFYVTDCENYHLLSGRYIFALRYFINFSKTRFIKKLGGCSFYDRFESSVSVINT